ncbi:MAG: DUF2807 domain-containing protein [Spirochaetales bacterium]|nr:DUF2807 domain-containing protein [Spirochaetales bacterium]
MKTRNIVALSLVSAVALYGIGAATKSLPIPAPWRNAPVVRTAGTELAASGSRLTEVREVGEFDAVEISGPVELVLIEGDSFKLTVTHDAALLPAYESELHGSTLRIGQESPGRSFAGGTPRVELVAPDLERLTLSGMARVDLGPLDWDDFKLVSSGTISGKLEGSFDGLELEFSGAGSILMVGDARELSISSPGASGIDAAAFDAESAEIRIAGVGTVDLGRTETLDVSLSGLGSLTYRGDPELTSRISGLGRVVRKGD